MSKFNKNGNLKTAYKDRGFIIPDYQGVLFIQIQQLLTSFHEVRYVRKIKPDKAVDEKDFQIFIKLKNGKEFELRYGKAKSGVFEGYYFKHRLFNDNKYIAIIGEDRIKRIKDFLKLNFTRTKEQNKPIFRDCARKTKLIHTNKCWKCGGSGYLPQYKYVQGGVCFACNADGHIAPNRQWNTDIKLRGDYAELAQPIQLKMNL